MQYLAVCYTEVFYGRYGWTSRETSILLIRWSRFLSLQDGSQAAVGVLPPLPYEATDLEPYIDNSTTTVHHDKHFNTYVTNLRYLVGNNSQLERFTLAELQRQVGTDLLNGTAATSLKNNGYSPFSPVLQA